MRPRREREEEVRFGLRLTGSKVVIDDVFMLANWEPSSASSSSSAVIDLSPGLYEVVARTTLPVSGTVGDSQKISVFFNKIERLPAITSVPLLVP
ncbi:MAG: hypothetical protein ACI9R3_003727 [Verrucomicrobiales bacterium]|jgi:hypothetical protein